MTRIVINTANERDAARVMSLLQSGGMILTAAPSRGMERGIHLNARESDTIRTGKSYQILDFDAYRRRLA